MQMYSFRRKLTLFCSANGRRNFMGQSEKAKFIAWKGGTNNMTDSEKLDLLLQKAIGIETEMQSLRDDVDELKQDMKEVKADIVYLKAEVVSLRSDVDTLKIEVAALREDVDILKVEVVSLRNDVDTLKQDMKEVKADIIYLKTNQKESRRYSDIILDEIERVHGILDKHQKDKSVHTA